MANDILVTLRADMKDLQSSFKTLQDNLKGVENDTNGLTSTFNKIGKIAGFTVIGKQVLDLGKDIVNTGKSFEAEMSKVKAISGATGEDFTALTNLAKELGSTTVFSASEASQGMQYLAMAGWKTQDIMAGLPAILDLSVASGADLARVADIASDAMTGFGMQANEAGHFADVLAYASSNANVNVELLGEAFKYVAPLAGTTNQSMETLTSAISKLGDAGIKGSMAGTALRAILNRLATTPKPVAEAMEELNVKIYDQDGKMKNLNTIIGEVTKATEGMDDAEKNRLFTMIAGTEALSAWNVLMGVGEDGLNSFTKELENADGSAKAMADTMGDNLQGSISNLESALEGLKIALYEKVKEPVRAVVDGMIECIEWVMNLDKWFNEHKNTIIALGSAFLILTAGIAGFSLYLKSGAIIAGFTGLISTIKTTISVVKGLSLAFLTCPVTWIAMGIMALVLAGVALWKNWDTVKAKCIEVWGAVKDFFSETWNSIKTTASEMWNSFKEWISGLWESIKAKAFEVWTAIKDFFTGLWEGIKAVAITVWTAIKDFFTMVWEGIKAVATIIWTGIVTVFEWVWSKIGGIVTTALGFIKSTITFVFQAIQIFIAVIWTVISGIFLTVWEGIKAIVSTAVNVIKTVIETVFNIVKSIISVIWEGIKAITSVVWEAIKAIISKVVNGIKVVVETVFNVVKAIVTTIWEGIKAVTSTIWNAIKSVISVVVNGIKSVVSTVLNAVKSFVSSVWEGIKSATRSAWELIKSYVINPVVTIKDKVLSAFGSLKDGVLGIWQGIKSGIAGAVNSIIRIINSMIGSMNKFSFDVPDWVPVMGGKSFGFNIPKIPEISWHAKGGIFTKPTVIGNHGFGEAGKEAILPLHKLPSLIGIDKQQELIDKILAGEAGATGGGTTINIERFENNREQDVAQLAKELEYYRQRYNFAKGVR